MTSGSRWVYEALADRFEDVATAEVRLKGLRHPHRTVRLLVVLQDRNQPSGGGERPVQRGRGLRLAVLVAVPDVQPPALERGTVRRRGHLAVPPLRRHPGLAVELAGRARAQVTAGHVDHPVRD